MISLAAIIKMAIIQILIPLNMGLILMGREQVTHQQVDFLTFLICFFQMGLIWKACSVDVGKAEEPR